MTYERMEQLLEARGYNIAGLTADEVDALAYVEGFRLDASGYYRYKG